MTEQQMQATARLSMLRVQQLAANAHQGVDSGPLTDDERLVYESALRAHEARPGVVWFPSRD